MAIFRTNQEQWIIINVRGVVYIAKPQGYLLNNVLVKSFIMSYNIIMFVRFCVDYVLVDVLCNEAIL